MEILLLLTVAGLIWLAYKYWRAINAVRILKDRLQRAGVYVRGIEADLAQMKATADKLTTHNAELFALVQEQDRTNTELNVRCAQLAKFQGIVDVDAEAARLKNEAITERQRIQQSARAMLTSAETQLATAGAEAARIIAEAHERAKAIAGEAYAIKGRADQLADAAAAMQRVIKGYGDQYLIPTYTLLDELADEFGHTEAGSMLKQARTTTRSLIQAGRAATCAYVEDYRRQIAINFVVDAFNGKVDSILARGKANNFGKLDQEIRDAFALVNHNGRAFRDAQVTPEYLAARLAELKWSAVARALKDQEREEQRQLREQMREEERARREYERAIKEAAKEEETLRKAMEKVQQQVATANEAQRAAFEAKLAELQGRLTEAEAKNQRALSMAQQTKTGHVYIISNIGSFGEEVFKIGMTRRLEPRDRVRELGDASVPFEFDIHALLFSDDAPGLERALHRHFLRNQVNKVNPRKEFFRVALADIRREIEARGITAHWTMTADAHDYRETLRVEQQIRENPDVERDWTTHQMEYEPEMEREEAEVV